MKNKFNIIKSELINKLGPNIKLQIINTYKGPLLIINKDDFEIRTPWSTIERSSIDRTVSTILLRLNWRERNFI